METRSKVPVWVPVVSRETWERNAMRIIRREYPDLRELMLLYRHLTPDMPELSDDLAEGRWQEILGADHVTVIVAETDGVLITAPNLMRGSNTSRLP
jgi:hypothetical protein